MHMFYAVLAYAMAVYNFYKALNGMSVMNYALAAMWLVIGIVFTVRHVKEMKKAKRKKELREREE